MSDNKAHLGFEQQPPAYAPAGYPPQQYAPQQPPQQFGGGMMYGQQNTSTVVVTQPGPATMAYAIRPPDYMAASIFACLCCFWPTGLCAIYFASQASSAAAAGDMVEATRLSNNARNLMISSVVIGVIWITLVIVLETVVYTPYNPYGY